MGRKAITRKRKEKSGKTEKWVNMLLPKLKNVSLKSLTMDDVAGMIGRSKSTVYEYFKTKEEVFTYMVDLQLQNLNAYHEIIEVAIDDENLIPKFEQFILLIAAGISNISHSLLKELQSDYPEIWANISSFINTMLEDLKQFYQKGIELKQFKNISPELMTKMDELFIFQIINDDQFFEQTQMSLDQVAKDYFRLKLEGMKT